MIRFRYPLLFSIALLAGACGGTVQSSSCIPGVASNVSITVTGSTNTVLHGCGLGDGGADGGFVGNGGGTGNAGGSGDAGGSGSGGGTTSSGGGGGTVTGAGGGAPPAPARGAAVPYWEYEAESATTNGTLIGPSRTFGDLSSEASGRKAVTLANVGQNVSFKTQAPANSIVVRYSVPDTTQSTAIDPQAATPTQTLGLYINGMRKASLQMTSRWSWTYGDADSQNAGSNSSGSGTAHHFYDETHLLFDEVPAGATIMLQKDAMDTAASYTIDLVDFEDVAAPLTQPAGSLSLTDYGAVANDGNDDGPALQNAINDAQTKGKTLWIPAGTFDILFNNISDVTKRNIQTNGIFMQGAGMWYTTLNGFGAQIKLGGNTCSFSDFLLSGDITFRDDTKGYQGFDGPYGKGSKVTNVWIEHTNVGLWVGHGAKPTPVTAPLTDGLVVHGIRVRDTYADGINLANATSNSTVEQSVFRNTGDDSMASWSFSGDGSVACSNDMFHFNTMQVSWRAACMSIYGGNNISMEDNVCSDTTNYPGILVSTTFSPLPLTGTTSVQRNTLTRDGGFHFNQQYGAIKFFADTQPLGGTITVKNIDITDPTFAGIHFGGSQQQSGITLDTVTVTNYATQGIWVASESHGTAAFNNVSVAGTPNVGLKNDAAAAFTVTKGAGDSGF